MKEFELISLIAKKFRAHSANKALKEPIGDDCSVIQPPKGYLMVTTADSLVDGNHFSSRLFTPQEIGRKVVRVNLSDLASMGARGPYYAWLTFALPPDIKDGLITGILDGIAADAKRYGVTLAGGNITGSKEFSIHMTLSGWTKPGSYMKRKGASAGDGIFISGDVGASTLAYRTFKEGKTVEEPLLKRWANPIPKLDLGIFLAENRIASACIDVSDGIFQDLRHITSGSRVGAVLDWNAIPVHPALKSKKPTPHMIGSGEDYELLFTVPEKKVAKLAKWKGQISRIGKIVRGRFSVVDTDGREIDISGTGYSHLT